MGNITVGQYSKIGTGAVVLKDVPPIPHVSEFPEELLEVKMQKILKFTIKLLI